MRQETEDGKSRQEPGLVRRFLAEEDGIGVVEIILIMVVLIAAVALFKNQIISLVTSILDKITTQSNLI